jgi:hypothetical protein
VPPLLAWLAGWPRERERVLSRSLRGLPPSAFVCRFLASHRPRCFQRDHSFLHLVLSYPMSFHNTSIVMLCFGRCRASSSSLVNVLLILRLRWSLRAGSGSASDNSTFTSLFSHCPLSSSRRCYHLISSHSKHKAATRARQSCPKIQVHRHIGIAPWSPTSKMMKRIADRSKAMVGVSRPYQGDGRPRKYRHLGHK